MFEEGKILAVDTALGACSAALLKDDIVLSRRFKAMERGHAEALAPMVEEVMGEARVDFSALDRLAVTVGPGTFTGQRVGLAFMRALRLALDKPLVGVTSLAAMAEQARTEAGASLAAAIHDARRGEVYVEIVGCGAPLSARLMTFEAALSALGALSGKIVLAGTAATRMAEVLQAAGSEVQPSKIVAPDAVWVARLAARTEPAGFPPRPLYLRAPDAKPPAGRAKLVLLTHPCNADILAALHAAAFADAWSAEWIERLMAQPGTFAYFAEDGGFVLVRAAGGEAEILTLAVAPAAQRRGIGSALISAAGRRALKMGAKTMFLEVGHANAPAQTLYERLGFREVARRKGYYGGTGGDARVLCVKLPLLPVGKPAQLD